MKFNKPLLLLAATATVLLAACGDSPDPTPPTGDAGGQVPASAAASPAAYVQFAASLQNSETARPLSLDNYTDAPKTETELPLVL